MVERAAVNRDVVGSSPTSGAIFRRGHSYVLVYVIENPAGKFYVGQTDNVELRLASFLSEDLGK